MERAHIIKEETSEDLNKAKFEIHREKAGLELLSHELAMTDHKIVQSKWNEKASILWVELENEEQVKEVFSMAAYYKNQKVRILTFFPSEIFARMKELETKSKEERKRNSNLKYQVRIGYDDIKLFLK